MHRRGERSIGHGYRGAARNCGVPQCTGQSLEAKMNRIYGGKLGMKAPEIAERTGFEVEGSSTPECKEEIRAMPKAAVNVFEQHNLCRVWLAFQDQ
jgi:hypothetical protein